VPRAEGGLVRAVAIWGRGLAVSVSSLPLGPEPAEPTRVTPLDAEQYQQHCSLIAADIADFSNPARDEEFQLYLRKSLYEIFGRAFRDIGVAWEGPCDLHREDRGDGMTAVFMPHIPTGLLINRLPGPLLAGLRHHNKMSSRLAQIQLRLALHAGLVTLDDHGFAGPEANRLFRILEAAAVKRELADSRADLALITSDYVYQNFIHGRCGSVGAEGYTRVPVNVKKTHTHAWYRLAGGPPPDRARADRGPAATRPAVRAAKPRSLPALAAAD